MPHPTFDLDGKTFAILPQDELERLENAARAGLDERADIALARAGLAEMAARPHDMLTTEEALRRADIGGLKFWRTRRDMSAAALAGEAGISPAYLSQIETGKKAGTIEVMKRLAEILYVTLNDLAG